MRSRIERVVTSDAVGLIILGVTALIRAVSYLGVDAARSPAHWLEGLMPAPAWSWVWALIGVACLVAVVVPRIMPAAVGLAVGINALWTISFMAIWAVGDSPRGYVSALGYGAVTLLAIWGFGRQREPEVRLTIDGR